MFVQVFFVMVSLNCLGCGGSFVSIVLRWIMKLGFFVRNAAFALEPACGTHGVYLGFGRSAYLVHFSDAVVVGQHDSYDIIGLF